MNGLTSRNQPRGANAPPDPGVGVLFAIFKSVSIGVQSHLVIGH
jgi:hypothetical protein